MITGHGFDFEDTGLGLGLGLEDYWPWPWPRTCCPRTRPWKIITRLVSDSSNLITSLGLEPRLADHRSQAARTVTLPTAPPRQAISKLGQ